MPASMSIIVNLRVPGVHRWLEAPDPVKFLRHPHRHEFHIRVRMETFHTDREVETLQVKHALQTHFRPSGENLAVDFGSRSCEQIAWDLPSTALLDIVPNLGERELEITVLEDGETGATYSYRPAHVGVL